MADITAQQFEAIAARRIAHERRPGEGDVSYRARLVKMAECEECEGAGVMVNVGGFPRPAHGWTGEVIQPQAGGSTVKPGEAYTCMLCSHSSALSDPSSNATSAEGL